MAMMHYPWLYDERRQVGTDYADEANVANYDANMRTLRNIAQEVEVAASALAATPASTIWEIGCGTGEISLGLAGKCHRVYASDVSSPMISFARTKAAERHIENVSFEEGGFLSGFRPPQPVNGVVSQLALHHLPDLWKLTALRRVAAALTPGGRLFLRDVVYPSRVPDYNAYFAGLVAGVRREGGDELAEQTIAHIREEYSTFAWVIEEMLQQAGFAVVETLPERFTTSYTCVKQGR
ncbi:MAG: class I SAM-dependent methyltransferase [Dehalococcoidia bacterium]|nr:class I SAM-dependent methyltransferase [Dehalococcoidia bacterium]